MNFADFVVAPHLGVLRVHPSDCCLVVWLLPLGFSFLSEGIV